MIGPFRPVAGETPERAAERVGAVLAALRDRTIGSYGEVSRRLAPTVPIAVLYALVGVVLLVR